MNLTGNRREYKLAAELFLLTKLLEDDFHPLTEDEKNDNEHLFY
jgi:hypothetical protein